MRVIMGGIVAACFGLSNISNSAAE